MFQAACVVGTGLAWTTFKKGRMNDWLDHSLDPNRPRGWSAGEVDHAGRRPGWHHSDDPHRDRRRLRGRVPSQPDWSRRRRIDLDHHRGYHRRVHTARHLPGSRGRKKKHFEKIVLTEAGALAPR